MRPVSHTIVQVMVLREMLKMVAMVIEMPFETATMDQAVATVMVVPLAHLIRHWASHRILAEAKNDLR